MTRDEPPAPPHIPDYELLRQIGRGSYGVVWLARSVTGLFRAVKIVWRASFEEPQPYEREFRGIKEFAAVSLVEPRQLALLHVGRNDDAGFFYYVMELADDTTTGREIDPERYVPYTLRELRLRQGRLTASETLALAVDLSSALVGLHAHKLVHRDIKPSNIIFVGGVPKLADIGLVTPSAATDVTISRVGNAGYMPPDFPGVPSADVYGLGRILYEFATGRDRDDYPRLPADLDSLPDRKGLLELNEIFTRACHADPQKRYSDAAAMRDDLLLLQAGKSVRRLRATERRLSRALRSVAILAIATAVAGTGAWVAQTHADKEMRLREKAEVERDLVARKSIYAASLTRAQRALENGEFGLARRLLSSVKPSQHEPDLRGFEWRALWNEARGDPAIVTHTDGEAIKRICLSPDGKLIAGQVGETRTIIWDANTLAETMTIRGTHHLGGFSADGEWIMGTNSASGLQRWRLATGDADTHVSPGINYPAQPLDSRRILGLTRDSHAVAQGLRIWDFGTKQDNLDLALTLPEPGSWIFMSYPAVADNGQRCAVVLLDQTESLGRWRLQVYDLRTQRLAYDESLTERITAVALSSDGRMLATASTNRGLITVRDLNTKYVLWRESAKINTVESLAFSPDQRLVLVGGQASYLRVLDTSNGQSVGEFNGHNIGILSVCWAADGKHFFSAGSGGDLRRWDIERGHSSSLLRNFWAELVKFQGACLSNDGTLVAASCDERFVRVATTGTETLSNIQLEGRFPLTFGPTNDDLLVLTSSGAIHEYSLLDGGQRTRQIQVLPVGVSLACADFSRNREILVLASDTGQLWFWNYSKRQVIGEARIGPPWYAVLSPDGRIAVTGGRDYTVRVWSSVTAKLVREWKDPRVPNDAAISPDGRWLAVCLRNGDVEVMNLQTFELIQKFSADSQVLYSIAFSGDGGRLYCGGSNGLVHVYSTDDWKLIVTLGTTSSAGQSDLTVVRLVGSAHSNSLLAYHADGTLRIWRENSESTKDHSTSP